MSCFFSFAGGFNQSNLCIRTSTKEEFSLKKLQSKPEQKLGSLSASLFLSSNMALTCGFLFKHSVKYYVNKSPQVFAALLDASKALVK